MSWLVRGDTDMASGVGDRLNPGISALFATKRPCIGTRGCKRGELELATANNRQAPLLTSLIILLIP